MCFFLLFFFYEFLFLIKKMEKLNVLVIPSDNQGGVGFYRSSQPHLQLQKQFPDEFEVTINMNPNFYDLIGFKKYQLIHMHKALFPDMEQFKKAMQFFKEQGIVTVMDIDDHWKLSPHHPQFLSQQQSKSYNLVIENLKLFDYVTTTTEFFAEEIKRYNSNVKIFPNAIDPTDPRFAVNKKPSSKLRVGMIMGSSHEYDVKLLGNLSNQLAGMGDLDKIQIVLCGFDTRGTITMINPQTGERHQRTITPKESVWYRYETQLTDNYKIVSPRHKQFLDSFLWASVYPFSDMESYKRCWTKDMDHYYEHYSEIDVLLVPLEENDFNKVKSPLKVAECCFSHTAIIAQNFGPYTLDLKNILDRNGNITPDGNAMLVETSKNHKQWAKYIHKLANDRELLKTLQDRLYESTHEKYDLRNVTKDRAEWYKKVVSAKKS